MTARTGPTRRMDEPGATDRWHALSVDATLDALRADVRGLTTEEAERRRAVHGPNELVADAPPTPFAVFAAQFADFMIVVLVVAAGLAAALGDVTDAIVIAAIVVLNAALGTVQELRALRALAALRALGAPTATVLRGGLPQTVPAVTLVPGEAVALEAGRIVPADLRLVHAAGLRIDESALTGESVPVDKDPVATIEAAAAVADRTTIAHGGTIVTHGRGLGIVVATGMRTEIGRIATLLRETQSVQTPLQRRLAAFGRRLTLIVLAICAAVFVAGWLRGEPPLQMLLTAISLAVAAIPEALPAVIGISLAFGARRMAAAHALARRLPAVETLGAVTYVCSDKTGTLTANRMRVDRWWCEGRIAREPGHAGAWRALLDALAVSHDATTDADGRAAGDPTEVALLEAAMASGTDPAAVRARLPRVAELPFDTARRCMTTIHRRADGSWTSITKGAVEVVLANSRGSFEPGDDAAFDRDAVLAAADAMGREGRRVLAFAVREWPHAPEAAPETVERGLMFVGLVGMMDPPREGVRDAVATCRDAGVVPVMITGDHPATARAVAIELGIANECDDVLTGVALEALSDAEFAARVRSVRVYARVAPEQKTRIVEALQSAGEVVAMTGDGVNDAPALQRADIGIAMGASGTDVARGASGLVLLDDDFTTIVRAIHEGRRIYDNLRRFVRYVLTTNSGELWTIALAPFLGLPVPLQPIHILWINLVTDGLPGIALAAEPAEPDVMRRPPRPPRESLFAHGLGAHALLVGVLMCALALGLYVWARADGTADAQTVVFTALCFMQLAHALAVRSERASLAALGLGTNRPLLAAVVVTVALQLALIYVPAANLVFRTHPLTATQLAACVLAALAVLGAVEAEKWVRRSALRLSAMPRSG
jgi:Ca2+-transporting ATPase